MKFDAKKHIIYELYKKESSIDRLVKTIENKHGKQEIIEKTKGDTAPEGYYTDDMGYWVEQDIRRHKDRFALYIFIVING